jgi:hypothetical protein
MKFGVIDAGKNRVTRKANSAGVAPNELALAPNGDKLYISSRHPLFSYWSTGYD